ncbi:hypothetical protein, partial [Microbacterium lacticum]|uniref:hypothetical protein n=2 Tax=Microbacterium lacticum TaxID=33885 RepID=UPI001F50C68E
MPQGADDEAGLLRDGAHRDGGDAAVEDHLPDRFRELGLPSGQVDAPCYLRVEANMMTGGHATRVLASLALGGSLLLLAGCGVVEDTLDGLTGSSPSPPPGTSEPGSTAEGSIIVTVEIDSDGTTATDLAVEINSPSSP